MWGSKFAISYTSDIASGLYTKPWYKNRNDLHLQSCQTVISKINVKKLSVSPTLRPIMSETSKTAKIILVLYWAMDLIFSRPCSWWWTVTRAGSHRQAGPDLRAVLAAPGSTLSRRMLMLSHFHLYGELKFGLALLSHSAAKIWPK